MSSSHTTPSHSSQYAPSAPSLPESYVQHHQHTSNNYQQQPRPAPPYSGGHGHGSYGYGYGYGPQQGSSSSSSPYAAYSSASGFPPGTHPDVVRSFQMVDRDMSGFIDEKELQQALSSGYQKFHIGTIRLLLFLFKNPHHPLRIGPKEFADLWSCLGQWRGIFERYDKDRSGKIDLFELRDALYGLGYAIPGSVLQVLIAKYDDGSGRKIELSFDSFVECGMIVKGLTDKFKEKDRRRSGSATFDYHEFMSTVIPFLVSYD